jgi:succinate dehydrogenase/fumarate reductase cytochrome b subunit
MKKILISLSPILVPFLALAQANVRPGYLGSIIDSGTLLLRKALVFLIALAVVWFIWNVIRYTMSDNEESKEKAKSQMIWGIVAIAVIVSVWGLVGILQDMFLGTRGVTGAQGNFEGMIPGVRN